MSTLTLTAKDVLDAASLRYGNAGRALTDAKIEAKRAASAYYDAQRAFAMTVECTYCGAPVGEGCWTQSLLGGERYQPHPQHGVRLDLATKEAQ